MIQQSHSWASMWRNHNLKKKKYMHPNVHCSTVYNSQNMEATLMPNNREDVHIHNGVLLSHKKE